MSSRDETLAEARMLRLISVLRHIAEEAGAPPDEAEAASAKQIGQFIRDCGSPMDHHMASRACGRLEELMDQCAWVPTRAINPDTEDTLYDWIWCLAPQEHT